MRIAIVNDMLMAVEAMRRVILAQGEHQLAWVARDGEEAVLQCERDRPDLVLMDLVMPRLDGIEATRRIMAKTPCAIVIVTANVHDYNAQVFEAMGAGALDAVNTPVLGGATSAAGPNSLLAKIDTIRRLISPTAWPQAVQRSWGLGAGASGLGPRGQTPAPRPQALVCIGTSAGGPAALARLLSGLPADFPAAVVIVQHVDSQFAQGLASWLTSQAHLPVRLAEEGDVPQAGVVLLAGRDHHLVLAPWGSGDTGGGASGKYYPMGRASPHRLGYTRAAADCVYCPSVDVFFKSVAQHCQGVAIGVLLTGMGRDGAEGLLALRQRGFLTLAQDEASSAVFGMPKAAAELNAAVEILALDKIAPRLVKVLCGTPKV